MNAFMKIAQKVLSTTDTLVTTNKIDISIINPWHNFYTYEISHNTNKTSQIYWMYHYISGVSYNSDTYILESPIKRKLAKFIEFLENPFIEQKTKDEFTNNYVKTQRTYRAFSLLALLYKQKRAILAINTDLFLTEIDPENKNTMKIYHEGVNYLFTLSDLRRHTETALLNSPYYFSEPLIIRNPYNNIPFTKSILYSIYFRLTSSNYMFPILFHNFVWLDFDLILFRAENECLIRETYFRKYIYNTPDDALHAEMICMLNNQYPHYIHVDADFPKKRLIELFRPHYYLYLMMRYHIAGLEKAQLARHLFMSKMCEICVINPKFGRKYISRGYNGKTQVSFNDKIPSFTMNDAYKYHVGQSKCIGMDSDSESDYENDTDSVS